jgi:hypothetical protein
VNSIYLISYQFWSDIWRNTFKEVKGSDRLFSDDFLRQDEVLTLWHNQEIIALFLFKWMDLSSPPHRNHSYLEFYPSDVLQDVAGLCDQRVMFMSYLTVHPDWRKDRVPVPISDLMLGLATKRFLHSGASALLSFTRNDRKVNDLVYRYGARPLKVGGEMHGIGCDFTAIFRQDVRESPVSGAGPLIQRLWEKRRAFVNEDTSLIGNPSQLEPALKRELEAS